MYQGLELNVIRELTQRQHFHPELEVLFVIEGAVSVCLKETDFLLQKEDVLVINSGVLHEITCADRAILCMAKFDYSLVTDMLKRRFGIFLCNSAIKDGKDYARIREIFHELIYQYIRRSHKSVCQQNGLMYMLLDVIIEDFMMSDAMIATKENGDDVRLQQIFQYVSSNFRTGVSLSNLAEELYVSTSTLSRFFKKKTGIYFADYVNRMKCLYAAQDLLYTKKSITKLAMDCGFSNPSVFNKVFREIYDMTPTEYRSLQRDTDAEEQKQEETEQNLRAELKEKEKDLNPSVKNLQAVQVSVDTRQAEHYEKFWNRVINMGSVYSLTLANVQYHALYLAQHLGFSHIRLWSVFSQKLMITDGVHIGNYNYDILDSVLDFLVSHRIRPFLDFGRRPDAVLRSENQPVFFGAECVEFQSKRAWEAMFEDFIRHVIRRYGKEEVSHWIFEISFDLIHESAGHYYLGDGYDPMEVYTHAYRTVKSLCPEAMVGGIGAVVDYNPKFLISFGEEVRKRQMIPDFVSFLLFPYRTQKEQDRIVNDRVTSEAYEKESVDLMRRLMHDAGLEECRLFVTEWNLTLSNRNFLNDSCFRGAYIIRKVSEIWGQVDAIGSWTGSDWLSSYYDTKSIANGGNGLLTKDSIRKPAYFALRFLNDLGEELIEKGDHYIITKKGQSYYILCFNFKWYSVRYFINEEGMGSPEALEDVFEDRNQVQLELVLKNMPENLRYVIKSRTVNEQCGSILNEWQQFQYDTQLTSQDVKYIRECCFARMMMERQTVTQGRLTIKRTLLPHEITMIHIYEDEL